jgi:hypothetical protein
MWDKSKAMQVQQVQMAPQVPLVWVPQVPLASMAQQVLLAQPEPRVLLVPLVK